MFGLGDWFLPLPYFLGSDQLTGTAIHSQTVILNLTTTFARLIQLHTKPKTNQQRERWPFYHEKRCRALTGSKDSNLQMYF